MIRSSTILLTLASALMLSGCVRTAASIVTAPVRVAGKAIDWTTTSQSEADKKRGRALRKRDEEIGKLHKRYQKHMRQCDNGSEDACERAREDYAALQDLRSRPI